MRKIKSVKGFIRRKDWSVPSYSMVAFSPVRKTDGNQAEPERQASAFKVPCIESNEDGVLCRSASTDFV
jgi:hypothetical protein